MNGKDVSNGVKLILGINPIFPICDPFVILTFNLYYYGAKAGIEKK